MKICFVTDGGRWMGMGHVQQSTTIASRLRATADPLFLTTSDETVLTAIREHGFEATRLRSNAEILQLLKSLDPDAVVFDKIDVEEKLVRDIRNSLKAGIVIFTNLTGANKYADIAVIADIGSQFQNITFVDEHTHTRYYYGPKYWILRPEFHEYKRRGKVSVGKPDRVVLIFGGSDPSNLTSVVLDELLATDAVSCIDVILGIHFGHDECLKRVLEKHSGNQANVDVYRNVRNVAELMYAADLAIASPGLSAFEALCVGTPVIVMPHDELQRDTYRGFIQVLERDDIGRLGDLIKRAEFTYPHEQHIAAMEIGEGVGDLVQAILRLVKREPNEMD